MSSKMDKEAQEKIAVRPHYCTYYFRESDNKFRGKYLYWGRCWCGYKASAYGQQLAECKMHGHTETMQLGYRKLPEGEPPLIEADSHQVDSPKDYNMGAEAQREAVIKWLEVKNGR